MHDFLMGCLPIVIMAVGTWIWNLGHKAGYREGQNHGYGLARIHADPNHPQDCECRDPHSNLTHCILKNYFDTDFE